jgi:hypothetical protein
MKCSLTSLMEHVDEGAKKRLISKCCQERVSDRSGD